MNFPDICTAFDDAPADSWLRIAGTGDLPSWFEVTPLAVESIAVAGRQLALLVGAGATDAVTVDRRLASLWFKDTVRPDGWSLPPLWDSVAGDYRTRDGWIRLHTNAPHHRRAALAVLGLPEDAKRDSVTTQVAAWSATELETAIVAGKGCAAEMRLPEAWAAHDQGRSVAAEPLVAWSETGRTDPDDRPIHGDAPLTGLRVLDLTRVLAGPVATRFLAAFGADVLRIDPPFWSEPTNEAEMTVGKRCAGLDMRQAADRKQFLALAEQADLLVHGYRPQALAGLGVGPDVLRAANPRLIDVALCAYGWTGPWAGRRGFDSLVQMSSGIAAEGQRQAGADRPTPLPVQALDHATGYLMAAACLYALRQRRDHGTVLTARLSLARTAELLKTRPRTAPAEVGITETRDDLDPKVEIMAWGQARRLRFPVSIAGITPAWPRPALGLRSTQAAWHGA